MLKETLLFMTLTGHAHINPMVSSAEEVVRRGHRVELPSPSPATPATPFDPAGCRRGLAWLDQTCFAIEGLRRSGWHQDARRAVERLLAAAEGLIGEGPVRENCDLLTGGATTPPSAAGPSRCCCPCCAADRLCLRAP
ncbi:hypothetical protein ABTY61_40890 [Kitasatospora sp. NPDC096128]|uniref:hypothetical protein n=1 Tax=Kitasatospora sp. NPDC096128 TaxID=3155547 RepID=UPI003318030F